MKLVFNKNNFISGENGNIIEIPDNALVLIVDDANMKKSIIKALKANSAEDIVLHRNAYSMSREHKPLHE